MKSWLLVLLLLVVGCQQLPITVPGVPVQKQPIQIMDKIFLPKTEGVIDQNCTVEKVCVSGYTSTVRPSSYYTNKLKKEQLIEYGYGADANLSLFEEDHIIPLELCGCPDCRDNLFPESYDTDYGARVKDRLENYLHDKVCSGKMDLGYAQVCIGINWIACGIAQGVFN